VLHQQDPSHQPSTHHLRSTSGRNFRRLACFLVSEARACPQSDCASPSRRLHTSDCAKGSDSAELLSPFTARKNGLTDILKAPCRLEITTPSAPKVTAWWQLRTSRSPRIGAKKAASLPPAMYGFDDSGPAATTFLWQKIPAACHETSNHTLTEGSGRLLLCPIPGRVRDWYSNWPPKA